MPAAPTPPAEAFLSIREAASRLLARRPDLASHRQHRKRARQVADSVGMRAAPVDVLAGWLGSSADLDVRDLEVALEDRVKLRLAALSPRDRAGADSPEHRARVALDLGWEQLQGQGPREVLRILAMLDGGPIARELVEEAAHVGPAATDDVVWAGFAQHDEKTDLLSARGEVLAHLTSETDSRPAAHDRPLRFVLAVRRHLAIGDVEDRRLDHATQLATDLAETHNQGGLVASLSWRAAERYRRRGDRLTTRVCLDRAWTHADHASARPLRGLLAMGRGILELEDGDLTGACARFEEAVAELEHADQEGDVSAGAALERARLLLGEALIATGELSRAEAELSEIVRALQRRCNESTPPVGDGADLPFHDVQERSLRASLAHSFRALGSVMLLRGDISGALLRLQEAREDWLDVAGPEDSGGAVFALAVARGLRSAGRFNEVEEPLEAARLLSGGDMDRPARPTLPAALHDLGVAAGDRAERASSATLLDEARMIAVSMLPSEDPLNARIAYTRGLLHLAEGELGKAQDKFTSVVEHAATEPTARALASAARAWAVSREGANRYIEAAADLEEAGETLSATRGASSTTAAHIRILRDSLR